MLNGKIFIRSNLEKKVIGGWIFHDQEGFRRGKSKKSSRNPDFFSTFTFWRNWYSDNPNIKRMIISAIASWWTSFHWELAVTLRATLVPVPRWASQELPSNASTWTSWPPRYWYSHLPSLVPTYPASSLLPVVESQVTNLKHLTDNTTSTILCPIYVMFLTCGSMAFEPLMYFWKFGSSWHL